MKVLYDGQIFSGQKIGGISRYFYELISRNSNCEVGILYTDNFYLKKNKLMIPDFRGKNRIINIFNKIFSIIKLKKQKYDIFHPTYYDNYFLRYLKSPFVVTVHDMIHEIYAETYFKEDSKTTKLKKEICEKANGIIAISEKTKDDLIEYFNIDEKKIKVIYHGSRLKKVDKKLELPQDYILFTGGRKGYKNFNFFMESISEILVKNKDLYLVCTGSKFTVEEVKFFEKLGIKNKVINILAKDEDMYSIYKNAKCFIFPSLYEGFGIPILEAFEAKCPIALSNTSCFPEIAGEAGEYFNPTDSISIKMAISNILNNKERREKLIEKGRERLKLFSWDKTYEETINFYKEIIDNSKKKDEDNL